MKTSNTTTSLNTLNPKRKWVEINKNQIFDFMLSEETQNTDMDKIEIFMTESINSNSYHSNVLKQAINDKLEYVNKLDMHITKVSYLSVIKIDIIYDIYNFKFRL